MELKGTLCVIVDDMWSKQCARFKGKVQEKNQHNHKIPNQFFVLSFGKEDDQDLQVDKRF